MAPVYAYPGRLARKVPGVRRIARHALRDRHAGTAYRTRGAEHRMNLRRNEGAQQARQNRLLLTATKRAADRVLWRVAR